MRRTLKTLISVVVAAVVALVTLAPSSTASETAPDGSGGISACDGTERLFPVFVWTCRAAAFYPGSKGNTIGLVFLRGGPMEGGAVAVDVPEGWSAPSTDPLDPGFVSATAGEWDGREPEPRPDPPQISISDRTIVVSGLIGDEYAAIIYGDRSMGGPGAAASTKSGHQDLNARSKASADGTFTKLRLDPYIKVSQPTPSPTQGAMFVARFDGPMKRWGRDRWDVVGAKSRRREVLTYVVPGNGMSNGAVSVSVPTGWSAPTLNKDDRYGFVHVRVDGSKYAMCGSCKLSIYGRTITVSGVTLGRGHELHIIYGSDKPTYYQVCGDAYWNCGAITPSTVGAQTWPTKDRLTGSGTIKALPSSPSIKVVAPHGSGTITTVTKSVPRGSRQTIVFTYTAAAGGMIDGAIRIDVPAGWSLPTTSATDPGYTTATKGQVHVDDSDPRFFTVNLSLAAGEKVSVTYGRADSGGPGALAPGDPQTGAPGSQRWQAWQTSNQEMDRHDFFPLRGLASSPSITVT